MLSGLLRLLSLLLLLLSLFAKFFAPPVCLRISFLRTTSRASDNPNISPWLLAFTTGISNFLSTVGPKYKKRVASFADRSLQLLWESKLRLQ